jgi:hypothetical protein
MPASPVSPPSLRPPAATIAASTDDTTSGPLPPGPAILPLPNDLVVVTIVREPVATSPETEPVDAEVASAAPPPRAVERLGEPAPLAAEAAGDIDVAEKVILDGGLVDRGDVERLGPAPPMAGAIEVPPVDRDVAIAPPAERESHMLRSGRSARSRPHLWPCVPPRSACASRIRRCGRRAGAPDAGIEPVAAPREPWPPPRRGWPSWLHGPSVAGGSRVAANDKATTPPAARGLQRRAGSNSGGGVAVAVA